MKQKLFFSLLSTAVACLLAVNTSSAAAIAVGDHSFETNAAINVAGDWSNDLSPEWDETGGPSNANAFEEFIAGFSADGDVHLGMNATHSVWQDLGTTFLPNTLYTLTVAVGNRQGQTAAGNLSTYSLYDSTGVSHATTNYDAFANVGVGAFADAPSLVLDTSVNPAAVGQPIRIQLDSLGAGRSHFDNIRLDASPIPEPSSGLLGLAGVALLFRRRRT